MAKKLKRAFTITELVIVIAVVAILAAVLIPTFSNIINKAEESADTQLVKNLNTILASEQTVSQEAAPTMSKALEQAQEGGYTVDKLTPTSDGDILWEQDSNRFVLVSGGEIIFKDSATTADIATEKYKFWKITNKEWEVAENDYSYYLAEGFAGTELTVKAGIDTGASNSVNSITYKSPVTSEDAGRTAIINTNKNRCNVTVDAQYDTVIHYGDAEKVGVDKVAGHSYREYGDVNTLTVGEGHIYVDEGGFVGILDCTQAATATVGKASTGTINTVYVKNSESAEEILDSSVKNAVEKGECDFVTKEQVPDDVKDKFAGGLGTERTPFLIANVDQFLAINELEDTSSKYFKLIDDIELGDTYTGVGGKTDSYGDWYSYVIKTFAGSLDGDGHTISVSNAAPATYTKAIFAAFTGAELKNVTVEMQGYDITIAGVDHAYGTFDSVITTGNMEATGNNHGLFVIYTDRYKRPAREKLSFLNCVNKATYVGPGGSNGYDAIFVGYVVTDIHIYFENCVNEGLMMSGSAAMFVANFSQGDAGIQNAGGCLIEITGCENRGNIVKTSQDSDMNYYYSIKPSTDKVKVDDHEDNIFDGIYKLEEDSQLNVEVTETNQFKVTPAANEKAVRYTVSFSQYMNIWKEVNGVAQNGGTLLVSVTETFTADEFESGSYVSDIKYLGFATANYRPDAASKGTLGGFELIEIDGTEYYRMKDAGLKVGLPGDGNDGEGVVAAPKNIYITAYDETGRIIAVKTVAVQ